MSKTTKSRFRRQFTIATVALATLLSMASAQRVFAMEKVSDVELAAQSGAARYSGSCTMHADFIACTPVTGESAVCATLDAAWCYQDFRYGYDYCSGSPQVNGPCDPGRIPEAGNNTFERRWYNHIRAACDCRNEGMLMNYVGSNWYCPHKSC